MVEPKLLFNLHRSEAYGPFELALHPFLEALYFPMQDGRMMVHHERLVV
jgi:hypothetical protein